MLHAAGGFARWYSCCFAFVDAARHQIHPAWPNLLIFAHFQLPLLFLSSCLLFFHYSDPLLPKTPGGQRLAFNQLV